MRRYEHVFSLKAEINTENTINKKVKLYTNGQNKKNTKNTQIYLPLLGQYKYQRNAAQSN